MKKEVKEELKRYKDWLNKNHEGMHLKISDYSLNKYIKEQLVCKHITTRNPKEHQENKCRFCGKPYQN